MPTSLPGPLQRLLLASGGAGAVRCGCKLTSVSLPLLRAGRERVDLLRQGELGEGTKAALVYINGRGLEPSQSKWWQTEPK